jgi:hypothetical protein
MGVPMSREARGCWFDTEGSLDPGKIGRGAADMVVTQMEVEPLLDYAAGARADGVKCVMYRSKQDGCYFVTIHGLENISRELGSILSYLRTKRKWIQVTRYRKYLAGKRLRHQHQAKRALGLLDSALDRMGGIPIKALSEQSN